MSPRPPFRRVPPTERTARGPAYEGRLLPRPDDEVVDQGAGFDARTVLTRRRMLGLVGAGAGSLALTACGAGSTTSSTGGTGSTGGTSDTVEEIPEETGGPYPGDGSNGPNLLTESGVVRSDLTTSIDGSGSVAGVPLTLTLQLLDLAGGAVPFAGAAVYAWQCDGAGRYSLYSSGVEDQTWLRGVQEADADGNLTFTTIVPGCYPGRWPHVHLEVYPDLDAASSVTNAVATSQLGFPRGMLEATFATQDYQGSAQNLAQFGSITDDMVFSDGAALQVPSISGDASEGYAATLTVAVDTRT